MRFLIATTLIWVLILPILILANMYPYFYSAFDRYGVYSNFADASSANSKFSKVLDYINFPFNTELDPDFFSNEDVLHMQDVRNIFVVVNLTFTISLVCSLLIFVVKKPTRHQILTPLTKLAFIFLLLILVLGIILIFTWDTSFNLFHQVLFPYNNYWQLDPSSSNLIKYLPQQIFQELALLYFIGVSIEFLTLRFILEKNKA